MAWGAKGEREAQADSSLSLVPTRGSVPETMFWVQIKSRMLNWVKHSGAPWCPSFMSPHWPSELRSFLPRMEPREGQAMHVCFLASFLPVSFFVQLQDFYPPLSLRFIILKLCLESVSFLGRGVVVVWLGLFLSLCPKESVWHTAGQAIRKLSLVGRVRKDTAGHWFDFCEAKWV